MVDENNINHFISSIRSVFSTMLSMEATVGKPYVLQKAEPNGDISAIIELSGEAIGCFILSVSMATGRNLASRLMGTTMNQEQNDLRDALGELANMIAGAAKAKFDTLDASISLPRVILGQEHLLHPSPQADRLCLPCHCQLGEFNVQIALTLAQANRHQPAATPTNA